MSDLPAPGWYPDPAGSDQLRWWSGAGWTDHLQARPQPVATPVPVAVAEPIALPIPVALPVPVARDEGVAQPAARPWPDVTLLPAAVSLPAATAQKPYVPFSQPLVYQQAAAPRPIYTDVRTTGAVWVLVLAPLVSIMATVLLLNVVKVNSMADLWGILAGVWGVSALTFVASIAAVVNDRGRMRTAGIEGPSAWWIVLSALAYLIARTVALGRQGIASYSPIVLYSVSLVVATALGTIVLTPFVTTAANSAAVGEIENTIDEALSAKTSTDWTVECPDTASVIRPNQSFDCSASDTAGLAVTVSVTIDARGGIAFSVAQTGATNT